MKSIRLILIACCFSLLSSCSLLTSLLKVPASLLKAVGRTAGIGLTDDAPEPVKEGGNTDTIESAAQKRQTPSE
ncbi:MAG: hypothetical protein QNL01_00465 [Akkermansiaceae bacterium]|jgi:hypothetical protein